MRLKSNIKKRLLRNMSFRRDLAVLRNTDTPNILALLRSDSELLTTLRAIEIIKKHTQIDNIKELFEEKQQPKKVETKKATHRVAL